VNLGIIGQAAGLFALTNILILALFDVPPGAG